MLGHDREEAGDEPLRRNGDFVRLWTGGAVSGLGSSITSLAYPLLALSVTTSAALAGLLGLVALAAGTLTRLPAGAVVDRVPLRRVLVITDLVRLVTTAGLAVSLVSGHLTLGQLLVAAAVNACAAAFGEIARSVALRHVVSAAQLPQAFALNEGRGHAISLVGQPAGGLLYATSPALPLVADLVSFAVSAVLSATIRRPLLPAADPARGRLRTDLLVGLRLLWREPFLRTTLFAAAAYQLVFGGAIFALIASFTRAGASPASLGALFAIAAVGGILGAIATPALTRSPRSPATSGGRGSPGLAQRARLVLRPTLPLRAMVLLMGWTAVTAFAGFAWLDEPVMAGILLGCVYFASAPANAMLLTAQISRTPAPMQGRVMAASYLVAGLAAPLGPPASGLALDATGPVVTFIAIAVLTAAITVVLHVSRSMRMSSRL